MKTERKLFLVFWLTLTAFLGPLLISTALNMTEVHVHPEVTYRDARYWEMRPATLWDKVSGIVVFAAISALLFVVAGLDEIRKSDHGQPESRGI